MKSKVEQQQKDQTQTLQTAGLLLAANMVLAPLWYANEKLGLTAAFAATVALLYGLHQVGVDNRPVANTINKANNFFSPLIPNSTPTIDSIDNAVHNIIEGGGLVCGSLTPGKK